MQNIPLTNDARQTFRTILGGQSVRVTAWWQPFDKYWYVSLAWLDGRGISSSMRLVEGGRPLRAIVNDFKGGLLVTGSGVPRRNSFTEKHRLVYLTESEL